MEDLSSIFGEWNTTENRIWIPAYAQLNKIICGPPVKSQRVEHVPSSTLMPILRDNVEPIYG